MRNKGNKALLKSLHDQKENESRYMERNPGTDKETFVGGRKFFWHNRNDSYTYKGGGKMEQKKTTGAGGFFSRVNMVLAIAYRLSFWYSEAKKQDPEAVKTLTVSETYKKTLEELKEKLSEFNMVGFNTVRRTAVERYLKGVITERGVLTLLDREAKRRYEAGEKVQGRPLAPFAATFKVAFDELSLTVKEEEGLYPTISHSMFLKTESALKKVGKFQTAMELAERVPEKWRKPFEKVVDSTKEPKVRAEESTK